MKTVKRLTVTVLYTVELGKVKVPEDVYNEIVDSYTEGGGEIQYNSAAYEWISNNINQKDAADCDFNIDDISTNRKRKQL